MKLRTLAYIVIVLLVVNVVALSSIAYRRFSPQSPSWGERPDLPGDAVRDFGRLRNQPGMREFMDRLRRENDSLVRPFFEQVGEKRRALFEELRKDTQDPTRANELVEQIGRLQTSIQRTLIGKFVANAHLLSPEQRRLTLRLIELRGERFERLQRGPVPPRGRP